MPGQGNNFLNKCFDILETIEDFFFILYLK